MTDAAPMADAIAHETELVADPSLRRRDGGKLLIGGSPLRFVRVSEAGAAVVTRWLNGAVVGPATGQRRLARRLIDAGMLHPLPPSGAPTLAFTVVTPVKDDPDGLAATAARVPTVPMVVVDDGSTPPLPAPQRNQPTTLLRHEHSTGPGAARNTGMSSVTTPIVAFVDAGVELPESALATLTCWFDDPTVVAVAPRVATTEDGGELVDYERHHSPLDLGGLPARVSPDGPITYVPSACLLVRTDAFEQVGGFDRALRYGEDVDLVWRLLDVGAVRYDPSVVAHHPARSDVAALARQRFAYGSAAGPLARRHGSRLAPVRMSRWSLAIWALALTGRPWAALSVATGTAVLLRRKLADRLPDPGVESAMLVGQGHWYAGTSLADVSVRAWWPATVVLAVAGARRSTCTLALLAIARRLRATRGPLRTRLRHLGLGLLDDGAYGAGVWAGAVKTRSLRCLLPQLAEWPGREDHSAMNKSSS